MKAVNPKLISEGIASALGSLGIEGKLQQYEAIDAWKEIVGEQIAQVTTAEFFSGGKLFVRVSRSTWRNELTFLKRQLIEKLNAAMHGEVVKDIIFK